MHRAGTPEAGATGRSYNYSAPSSTTEVSIRPLIRLRDFRGSAEARLWRGEQPVTPVLVAPARPPALLPPKSSKPVCRATRAFSDRWNRHGSIRSENRATVMLALQGTFRPADSSRAECALALHSVDARRVVMASVQREVAER